MKSVGNTIAIAGVLILGFLMANFPKGEGAEFALGYLAIPAILIIGGIALARAAK
jgi:hypothetical protein